MNAKEEHQASNHIPSAIDIPPEKGMSISIGLRYSLVKAKKTGRATDV
jgi:hypothetical protein